MKKLIIKRRATAKELGLKVAKPCKKFLSQTLPVEILQRISK